ncbi:MAG: hypothetical protein A3J38_04010 [Gammaproteobacteria bacterium RIFCSPHIGHO2_12_FULL_45_9]|nr:MAG: hypothetical protein A3J38_04010 [Gammaproteobacteria bacterium RIFCSPHIGHO2_12_FULL_45_9]
MASNRFFEAQSGPSLPEQLIKARSVYAQWYIVLERFLEHERVLQKDLEDHVVDLPTPAGKKPVSAEQWAHLHQTFCMVQEKLVLLRERIPPIKAQLHELQVEQIRGDLIQVSVSASP